MTRRSKILRCLLILPASAAILPLTGCDNTAKLPPSAATTAYAEGALAYRSGNAALAKTRLTDATRQDPELINARTLLGDMFRAEGDYKAALEQYEVVVKLDPYSSSSYYRLGLAYQFLERFLEAKNAYLKALEIKPSDADTSMNLGLVCLALGDLPAAMQYTKAATELGPTNPDALANHGVVLDAVGDHVGAQRAFLGSLELSGDKPSTLLNLAQSYLAQARGPQAQEILERLLKSSDSAIARKRLGDAHALQGHASDAVAQYEVALRLDPRYYPAMNEAGRVIIQRYRAGNELDESLRLAALGYWNRSLAIAPTQPLVQALVRQWEKPKP